MDFAVTDLFNLFDILRRSSAHQALTPSERAWLKAYKGIVRAVLLALALALYQFYAAHNTLSGINWQVEIVSFCSVLWTAYLDARAKFFTAQNPVEVQTGQIMASVAPRASTVAPAPAAPGITAPLIPADPAPVPAPAVPVSGGEELPLHFPTNPMLKNVPLPRAQRSARDVH